MSRNFTGLIITKRQLPRTEQGFKTRPQLLPSDVITLFYYYYFPSRGITSVLATTTTTTTTTAELQRFSSARDLIGATSVVTFNVFFLYIHMYIHTKTGVLEPFFSR